MRSFTAVIEKCPDTNLYVGFVPGFPGAHAQGADLDELQTNLREVIAMLLEDGNPQLEAEFVGIQTVAGCLTVGRVPVLKPREVEALLLAHGFVVVRQRGSHRQYQHPDGRRTTLPFHAGRDISPILLRQVARDAGLTVETLLNPT